jgi:molybdenum cofactor cytidylyltransferase
MDITGILLAAGRGRRFDPSGVGNKLLAPLASAEPVATASARAMLAALPRVIAVAAPGDGGVAQTLREAGCVVTVCAGADSGMAASLVHGLRCALEQQYFQDQREREQFQPQQHLNQQRQPAPPQEARPLRAQAQGWIIGLADMPYVTSATVAALRDALAAGAAIAVPLYQGRRGNPVGFSGLHLAELLALQGDRGARALLAAHPVTEVAVDDPGILRDIDTAADLKAR